MALLWDEREKETAYRVRDDNRIVTICGIAATMTSAWRVALASGSFVGKFMRTTW